MKTKSLIAGIILATSSSATMANQFYIDIGMDKGGNGVNNPKANGATTTGWLDQIQYNYASDTLIIDANLNGIPETGEVIHTEGGFLENDFSSLTNNQVTSFLPDFTAFSGPSDNGFGMGDWGLTFQFELDGTLGVDNKLNYTSGNITFYYYDSTMTLDDTSQFIDLFTVDFLSITQNDGGSFLRTVLSSVGDGLVNGVAAGDVFNFDHAGITSMTDVLADDIYTTMKFDFNTDEPLDENHPGFVDNGDGTLTISGVHDGSADFIVPEPSSLAVLGLGLLGLAGAARRRKN